MRKKNMRKWKNSLKWWKGSNGLIKEKSKIKTIEL